MAFVRRSPGSARSTRTTGTTDRVDLHKPLTTAGGLNTVSLALVQGQDQRSTTQVLLLLHSPAPLIDAAVTLLFHLPDQGLLLEALRAEPGEADNLAVHGRYQVRGAVARLAQPPPPHLGALAGVEPVKVVLPHQPDVRACHAKTCAWPIASASSTVAGRVTTSILAGLASGGVIGPPADVSPPFPAPLAACAVT